MIGVKLRDFIVKKNPKRCAIVCHHNADPDAICSAYALRDLLKKIVPALETYIVAPEGVSLPSKRIAEYMGGIVFHDELEEPDIIVLVDTCTFAQLGILSNTLMESLCPLIVIDHHRPHSDVVKRASLLISDETASSTCELIYLMFNELKVDLDPKVALALLTGIIYDSRRFINASSRTFRVAAELIDKGANHAEALKLLQVPMDISEKIARLKAAQRLKIYKIHGWLVVTSYVSSYEASAARALIDLGADVVFVAGGEKPEVRVSARSRTSFYQQTKIHLGRDVMEKVGVYIQGAGGGHATAAGANGIGDPEKVLELCIKLILEKFGQ